MDDSVLTTALGHAGFTSYGAAVYVSLLGVDSATASDIAVESGVPQPRVYDVIERLERDGYVETVRDGTLRVRIGSTTPLVESLESRAARFEDARTAVREQYRRTTAQSDATNPDSASSLVTHIREAVETADRALWAALSPAEFTSLCPTLRDALDRGVDVRIALNDPEWSVRADACADVCTEARRRDLPGPTLVVVDWGWATVALGDESRATTTAYVVADTPAHASIFHWYFLTCLWDGWPAMYAVEASGLPVCYTELRACVDEVRRHVAAGHDVFVRVEGYGVGSGRRQSLEGVVADVVVEHPPANLAEAERARDQSAPLGRYSGRVSLVVETEAGTFTVGGRGAVVEDVRAECVTVLDVAERPTSESREAADTDRHS